MTWGQANIVDAPQLKKCKRFVLVPINEDFSIHIAGNQYDKMKK